MNIADLGAALVVMALRRLPHTEAHVGVECRRCGGRASAPVGRTTPGREVVRLLAELDHECAAPALSVVCDDDRAGGLTLDVSADGTVRVGEPAGDRRWTPNRSRDLLLRIAADIDRDDAAPVGALPAETQALPVAARPLAPFAERTVHGAFHRQALRTPDATAVRHAGRTATYREVAERAAGVAAVVAERADGRPVAVDVTPGLDEPAVLLGILAAGVPYVPIDRRSPRRRIARMFDVVQPALVIGAQSPVDGVDVVDIGDVPAATTPLDWSCGEPDHPAYIIFTSGSTGEPKGVVVAHESVLRLAFNDFVRADSRAVGFLRAAPLAFDASTLELWMPLLNGGYCVPLTEPPGEPEPLRRTLAEDGVAVAFLTTSLFHQLADVDPAVFAPLATLIVGGEVVRPETMARVADACPRLRLMNGYGPTENTTFTTTFDFASIGSRMRVPIGSPLCGDHAWVADADGRRVPQGFAGELVVAGPGVALGYLTGAAVAPDDDGPFGTVDPDGRPTRRYRTGDMVADLGDGTFDFLGRVDAQVKHRGFRIELTAVEAALVGMDGVRHAAVALDRAAEDGRTSLVGVVVPEPGTTLSRTALRRGLRDLLPEYAVPDDLVSAAALPLNGTGKVDRREVVRLVGSARRDADRTGADTGPDAVRAAVERVLGFTDFDDDENLVVNGLHSLQALRLVRELRHLSRRRIGLAEMMADASVAGLRRLTVGSSDVRTAVSSGVEE